MRVVSSQNLPIVKGRAEIQQSVPSAINQADAGQAGKPPRIPIHAEASRPHACRGHRWVAQSYRFVYDGKMTSILPHQSDGGPLIAASLRQGLRRWRTLHRVKQAHLAELLGVTQSTISRWESGTLHFEDREARRIEGIIAARLTSSADTALRQLIEESARTIHLVCDVSHRLLACSASRASSFGTPVSELLGRSLWRFSTMELIAQEKRLETLGWHDVAMPQPVEFETGNNRSDLVPIRPSRCRWTRMTLSDGTSGRLVETLGSV